MLRQQAIRDARALWGTWTPGSISSWQRMTGLAIPVIEARRDISNRIAAAYFRDATGERAFLAAALAEEQILKSLAATGLVGVIAAHSAGKSIEAAAQVGFVRFSGGLSRLVLSGGRDTIVQSARERGVRWQRVTGGSPCEWCSEQEGQGATDSEVYPSHDHCACSVAPVV